MDLALVDSLFNFDTSLFLLVGWSILNKSSQPKRIFFKRHGNDSGQFRNVPPHTSITLPDDQNYQFWDADTQMPITPKRQVIINKDGYFE